MPEIRGPEGALRYVHSTEYDVVVSGDHAWSEYNLESLHPTALNKVLKRIEERDMKTAGVRIGADPEFFIGNDKNLISSIGLIGGTKGKGVPIVKGIDATWLEDNVAVELNGPPQTANVGFAQFWKTAIKAAAAKLKENNLHAILKPSITFKPEHLSDPKAHIFGCDADFCAYDEPTKPRSVDPTKFGNMRFAGGHIHLSYSNPQHIPNYAVVMLMDALIGIGSLSMDRQEERRPSYGLAGLFRHKKYGEDVQGVEYRTLSNFWLGRLLETSKNEDQLDTMVAYMAGAFVSLGKAVAERPDELSKLFTKIPLRDVQNTINKEDIKSARELNHYIYHLPEVDACRIDKYFGMSVRFAA